MLLQACKNFKCPLCEQLAPPFQAPKSALKEATTFNQRLLSDTFWLTLPGGKTVPILSIMDSATRYMTARLLHTESSEQFLKALERNWIKTFGPPESLHVDAHPSWGSAAVRDWTTEHGIELTVSPGEAHQRLSQVERRHQVLRRALDIYLSENNGSTPLDVKQALCYVLPQLNRSVNVKGYSPVQWVLGYQPKIPGNLLDEGLNQSHLFPSMDFKQKLQLRASAGRALLQADTDERLRRASLLRQSHTSMTTFSVGQRVFYYREGSGVGPRIRWKGPATVTMIEPNKQGKVSVVWIVHGAQLIRAAPEHLRHDHLGQELPVSPKEAWDSVRGRGTTTFLDLSKTNRGLTHRDVHMLDTDDEQEPAPKSRRRMPHPATSATYAIPPTPSHPVLPSSAAEAPAHATAPTPSHPVLPSSAAEAPAHATTPTPSHPVLPLSAAEAPAHTTTPIPSHPVLLPSAAEAPAHIPAPTPSHIALPSPAAHAPSHSPVHPVLAEEPPTDHIRIPVPADDSPPATPPDLLSNQVSVSEPADEPEPHAPTVSFLQRRAHMDQEEFSFFRPPAPPDFNMSSPDETFRQQRARVDRTETLPFRVPFDGRSRSPPPRAAVPPAPPTAETAESAYSCEVLSCSTVSLPHGWAVSQDGHLDLGSTADQWEWRDRCLVRRHFLPRRSLFDPRSPGDCPVPVQWLSKTRTTFKGKHRHSDRWRSSEPQIEPAEAPWTGFTSFKILPRYLPQARESFYHVSDGFHSFTSQEAPNSIASTGTGSKKRKDPIDERTLSLEDRVAFIKAKRLELASFFENSVWEFDHAANAGPGRVLKARFILKWAKNPDGSPRAKARLVTQGFNDPDALSGSVARTSPTLGRLSRQVLLSMAATLGWTVSTGDISTAFLQGKEHDKSRTLWIRLPAEAKRMLGLEGNETLMRLRKPMYGLVDAPRAWFREARDRLLALGFKPHPLDQCLFLLHDMSSRDSSGRPQLVCMLGLYVDDLLCIGNVKDPKYQHAKSGLHDSFAFREWHEGEPSMEYLGAEIESRPDGSLFYHQSKYLAKLHPITIEKSRLADPSSPVTEKERTKLRALIGGLQWSATQTAPHVQPHTSLLAGQAAKATVSTLQAANKALRFAKENSDVGLHYQWIGDVDDLVVVGYSDASFACREDLGSQGGYLITLSHKDMIQRGIPATYHVLDWRSFKLPRIARSTLSAESQAAAEAADAVYFASLFIKACLEPDMDLSSPQAARLRHESALVVDAKALYDLLIQDELQTRLGAEKRTAIEVMVTKDRMAESGTRPRWVSSERQLADGLTKESATQLLACRLRTHMNKLVDDDSYEAARKKNPERRQASAMEFALHRPQAASTALFACLVQPAMATSLDSGTGISIKDLCLMLFTFLVGLLLLKLLWMPWTRAEHRLFVTDDSTQTEPDPPRVEQSSLTEPPPVQDAAVHAVPTARDQWTSLVTTTSLVSSSSQTSVAYRRDALPSSIPQASETALSRSVGLQVMPSCRTVGLQFGTNIPASATISFPPSSAGPPTARGVPFEHRCPNDLTVYITPSGDAWHTDHTCADSRTRGNTRAFRPCRVCATGYTFPQLLYQNNPTNRG